MKEKLIALFCLLSLSSFTFSSNYFSKKAIRISKEAGQGHFSDPYIYSVWGAGGFLTNGKKAPVFSIKKKKVRSTYFRDGKLNYRFTKGKNKKGMKAPLMIYLPGIFSDLDSGQNDRMLNVYRELGIHVAVFANPLSKDVIDRGPLYQVGNPISEGRAFYQSIRRVVKELKGRGLLNGEVHLSGVSYGAFMSSVIAAIDASHKNPVITGNVTAISPPYHFLSAMKRLDKIAKNTEESYSFLGLRRVAPRALKIFKLRDSGDVSENHMWDSRGIVAHFVFKENFIESVKAYNKHNNAVKIPKKKKAYQDWYKKMSFVGYYKRYANKSYKELSGKKGSISYWMNIYKRKTRQSVRVITTQDDFLNSGNEWEKFNRDQVIVLENGGHYGYRKDSWFKRFLKIALL